MVKKKHSAVPEIQNVELRGGTEVPKNTGAYVRRLRGTLGIILLSLLRGSPICLCIAWVTCRTRQLGATCVGGAPPPTSDHDMVQEVYVVVDPLF
jgi:hypothetical protein